MTTPTTGLTLNRQQAGQIAELLEITDAFLRRHLPAIADDLDALLRERDITGGPSWLIDMAGLTALHLRRAAASAPGQETGDE